MIALPEAMPGVLAFGWATVELDRAAKELAHLLAPGAGFGAAASSAILGARCRSGPAAGEAGLWIALLEPETEGRLAGTLARFGEEWAATWALATAPPGTDPRASAPRPGPFGAERLLLGGPPTGLHRLVVEAVPSPP